MVGGIGRKIFLAGIAKHRSIYVGYVKDGFLVRHSASPPPPPPAVIHVVNKFLLPVCQVQDKRSLTLWTIDDSIVIDSKGHVMQSERQVPGVATEIVYSC